MNIDFKNMTILGKIQFICVFIPILTTIAFVIHEMLGNNTPDIIWTLIDGIAMVGYISAIICIAITSPLGIIKLFFSFIKKGWSFGIAIFPFVPFCFITAVVGLIISFMLLFAVVVFAPIILTVYFYFFYRKNA